MSGSRTAIKQALANTLKSVPGVNSVYTYLPRNQQGMNFPSIVIKLEKTHETAVSKGNPGRRHVKYNASLYIQTIDMNPNEGASQQAFDDLLDAIDDALHNDKTLGGTVLMSAWDYIDTEVFDPQLAGNGQAILMRAIKNFDILTEIIA